MLILGQGVSYNPIRCISSVAARDLQTNFNSINDRLTNFMYVQPNAVRRLRDFITNGVRVISLHSTRGYQTYLTRTAANTTLSNEERNTLLTDSRAIVDSAIDAFKTTETNYTDTVNSLYGLLSPTKSLAECQQLYRKEAQSQIIIASTLAKLPSELCKSLNSALADYGKVYFESFTKLLRP